MEREYLDYYDWLNAGGLEGTGQQAPPQNPYVPAAPTPAPSPTAAPAPTTPTGKTPEQIEAEGREYDRQHGLIGGYMMDGQWVNGSPYGGGGGTSGGDGGGDLTIPEYDASGFQWPSYTAPAYQSAGPFTPRQATFEYTPFAYKDFEAPTIEQARQNPGYQFAAQEGINRLENSAAGRGVLRSGMTLKDIIGWGNKFADQNYDQVFNRDLTTYGTNRSNAFDSYKTNLDTAFNKFTTEYGIDRDIYDRYATDTYNGNNYRLTASQAEFAPKFDASKLEFADLYARWKAKLDAATQIATGGPQ